MPLDPSALRLRTYPDPVLRTRAVPVPGINEDVRVAAREMLRIMVESDGIGLAGPQVGLGWRMFVADVPADKRAAAGDLPSATQGPVVYINPVLSKPTGPVEPYEEGCLSLPDIRGDVLRPPVITITAMDVEGNTFTHTATGLLARCWQHEVDHLDGVLIIDKMTAPYRLKNRAAIKDLERDFQL
jgi:peptide deformylase